MKAFSYDFTVKAASQQEADTKMQALSVLASRLSADSLKKVAHVVQNDPAKTALAMKFLG